MAADAALEFEKKQGRLPLPQEFETTEPSTVEDQFLERTLRWLPGDDYQCAPGALSVPRWFDMDIFFELGEAVRVRPTRGMFVRLVRFSFVSKPEERRFWLRQHIRGLLEKRLDENEAKRLQVRPHKGARAKGPRRPLH